MQIVKKQDKRMLRPGEYAEAALEHHLEAVLRVLRWQLRHRRLAPDDQLELGDQGDHQVAARAHGLLQGISPTPDLDVALTENLADQGLQGLRQGGVGDVALVLVEFAGGEEAAGRDKRPVQLVYNGGFADAGIARDQHEFRRAGGDHPIERGEQGLDLALSAVKVFRHQQPVRRVVLAQREFVDPASRFPLRQAQPQVMLHAGRGLIAFLGRLGKQLHGDGRDRDRHIRQPLGGRYRLFRDMAVDPLHGIGGGERQGAGEHPVERDAEGVEVAASINRTVHPPGLFRRHVGQRAGDEFGRLGRLPLAGQA
ncbi:MAG TPA: hypothetical protein VMB34_21965 [Acetobacteraceae bacterium]|nr:hypothetical protein [Acetobacteraceae bacterium]